ncbi:hypothetical protein FGADI_3887 [Fusarium gaditjirri]|uniref:Uncharacterized protein n=1 Tax=Fusarium gaditjirri TaxID=282569 RepID=A0A8H4TE72_9HYPO|nr:hypothetical protein FGADI_3887 [Fusarium gaditjirri]
MSFTQDNTEARDDSDINAEHVPSLLFSKEDTNESSREPESQAIQTGGNRQSKYRGVESLIRAIEGLQVQSNPTKSQSCVVRVPACPCQDKSTGLPPRNYDLTRFPRGLGFTADLFIGLDNHVDEADMEGTKIMVVKAQRRIDHNMPAAGRIQQGDSIVLSTKTFIAACGLPKRSVRSRLERFLVESTL